MPFNEEEEELLARLNALKPTTLAQGTKLENRRLSQEHDDDLAARFLRHVGHSGNDITSFSIAGGSEDIEEANPNADYEQDLDELLAELEDTQWKFSKNDEERTADLLKEAEDTLTTTKSENQVVSADNQFSRNQSDGEGHDDEEPLTEDQEVDACIEQALAESSLKDPLEIDSKVEPSIASSLNRGTQEQNVPKPEKADQDTYDVFEFNIPSPPTNLLPTQTIKTPPATSTSLASVSASQTVGRPSLSTVLDKGIEAWCIICNDDATVKCRGCDGDLYCARCWKEGHLGESAGFEEKTHRWTKFEARKSG